jgi:hypothetical protein
LNLSKADRDQLVRQLWEAYKGSIPAGFRPVLAVLCPYCIDEERASIVVAGDDSGIFHSRPLCAHWIATDDPADFLEGVRARFSEAAH